MTLHVAVTGASSGIGEGLVREYAAQGASVTLVARRLERMQAIAEEVGGKTHVARADMSQLDTCCDWVGPAEEALGPIDVLVNNAGVQIVARAHEVTHDDGEWLQRINLFAPLRLIRQVLPGMLARKGGTIINVASMAALAPTPGMTDYSASKAALAAYSESLRGELRKSGVNVVTVYPGPVETAMARTAHEKLEAGAGARYAPEGTTEQLAVRIRKAVERRCARVVYPRVYGAARHFPNLTRFLVDRLTPPVKALPEEAGDSQA